MKTRIGIYKKPIRNTSIVPAFPITSIEWSTINYDKQRIDSSVLFCYPCTAVFYVTGFRTSYYGLH